MNEDGHVLKSRRGLLAAGLAVAVVGAMGVASIQNAGADQIPDGQASTEAAASPSDEPGATGASPGASEVHSPPPLLPWGDPPRPAKLGQVGMDSNTLRAKGLDAAPDNTAHDDDVPKGDSDDANVVRVAPRPAPLGSTPVAKAETDNDRYFYILGQQRTTVGSMYAAMTIGRPTWAGATTTRWPSSPCSRPTSGRPSRWAGVSTGWPSATTTRTCSPTTG